MTKILTQDHRMLELIQLAKTVAASKATILIQGESGTGKELVANLIHENSNRGLRPIVAINCAAIPETLLESELFGYEKGSFTGAVANKAGKFELANGSTLLLDEISEMDIRLQAKLLRVIQEGEVDRIGARKPLKIDVRIIATTNRNLTDCVREGKFREDLFYRLNVVNLTMPPLRERLGDVRLLGNFFLKSYAEKNKKQVSGFSNEALALLEAHLWLGNVRELENVIERAVITSRDMILTSSHIYLERRSLSQHNPEKTLELSEHAWLPGQTLDSIEKGVILEALKFHHGNRTHTAKALGISIRTLRNKIAEFRRGGIHV